MTLVKTAAIVSAFALFAACGNGGGEDDGSELPDGAPDAPADADTAAEGDLPGEPDAELPPDVPADVPADVEEEELPTGEPGPDEVVINETARFQTLDGVGANSYAFPYAGDQDWDWDAVRFVYDEIDFRYVRLASWLSWWESANDNADPYSINWDGFQTDLAIIDWHDVPYAQYLDGLGIEVMLGVWNVADWLAGGDPRTISPDLFPELGELISAYILYMDDNGVPMAYVEVQNEPAIQAGIEYPSPEDLRDAALVLIDQLDRNGLSHILLHGPNFHTPPGTVEWAEVWLADDTLRARTAAVSYHTWWSEAFEDYDAIREVAERYGRPVWATELGRWADAERLQPATWETAWDTAMSFYRAIAWSRATRLYHWTSLGHDAIVSTSGDRTPTFYAVKRFANHIPPGSTLLDTASGDADVLALAFALPSGGLGVILINGADSERTVWLRSVRGVDYEASDAMTTARGALEEAAALGGPDAGGRLSVTLPPQSIASLDLLP